MLILALSIELLLISTFAPHVFDSVNNIHINDSSRVGRVISFLVSKIHKIVPHLWFNMRECLASLVGCDLIIKLFILSIDVFDRWRGLLVLIFHVEIFLPDHPQFDIHQVVQVYGLLPQRWLRPQLVLLSGHPEVLLILIFVSTSHDMEQVETSLLMIIQIVLDKAIGFINET